MVSNQIEFGVWTPPGVSKVRSKGKQGWGQLIREPGDSYASSHHLGQLEKFHKVGTVHTCTVKNFQSE